MRSLPKLLGGLLVALASLVVAASVIFMVAEDLKPLQALYFAVVTVTTVGYGDIHPKTSLGMILCVIMILGGVGVFTGGVGMLVNAIVSKRDRDAAQAKTRLLLQLFINSIGIGLLNRFNASNPEAGKLQEKLSLYDFSSEKAVQQAKQDLVATDFVIDLDRIDSVEWRTFLKSHSEVFLVLLSNPTVSEGFRVTSVLQRTYNLDLALKAYTHAALDDSADGLRSELEGIYFELTLLWLDYMAAMAKEFPYVARKLNSSNPFKEPVA